MILTDWQLVHCPFSRQQGKSKQLRILQAAPREAGGRVVRQVGGGFLLQNSDDLLPEDITFTVVSTAQPTEQQLADLRFAWRIVKHVKVCIRWT